MALEVDGQTDRRTKLNFGQVTLILRLCCKQEIKDIYIIYRKQC